MATLNRNQTEITVVTSATKAGHIASLLEKENRLQTVIRYNNYKLNKIEYYIFYYNYR